MNLVQKIADALSEVQLTPRDMDGALPWHPEARAALAIVCAKLRKPDEGMLRALNRKKHGTFQSMLSALANHLESTPKDTQT